MHVLHNLYPKEFLLLVFEYSTKVLHVLFSPEIQSKTGGGGNENGCVMFSTADWRI